MSKDTMSKIRSGDVWKRLERVLSDYHIPRSDFSVEDVRPHPKLTVTFCGRTRTMAFAGTPGSTFTCKADEGSLRRMLRQMQMESLSGSTSPAPQHRPVVKAIVFRGVEIDTVMHDGEPHVALKPIVEGMGLDWEGQRQRVTRDSVLAEVAFDTQATGRDGKSFIMKTIPLRFLNGFLFGIDDSRVRPELREGVIAYKRECYDALARYWIHGAAVRSEEPTVASTDLSRDALHDLGGVVKAVTGKAVSDLRADVYAAIDGLAALIRSQQSAPAPDLVVVRDFVSSFTIVADMAMVPAERRYPGLTGWVSRRMVKFSSAHGFEVKRVQRFPGEKLVFPRSAAEEWLRTTGMREIWGAVDRRKGIGQLFGSAA